MSERLAATVRRFRWPVVALWLVALAVAGIAARSLPDRLSGGGWYVPGSQSQQAASALRAGFTGRGASTVTIVVRDDRHPAGSPQFQQRVGAAMGDVTGDRRLAVASTYGWNAVTDPGRFVGADRHTAIALVGLGLDDGTARRVLPRVQSDLARRQAGDGIRVALVSAGSFWGEINTLSESGLRTAELVTLPLILLILLLLYRGVVAAVVSFVVGLTATVLTFGLLAVIARHHELSIFVQNAATMIGLGVSVDYSLFMISRYTEELSRRRDRTAALAATLRTSGTTVAFSGAIVILAMSSLFLVDLNVIRSIALGVVVVVACAVVTTAVVLPAVLYLLGAHIRWGRHRGRRAGRAAGTAAGPADGTAAERFWSRLARHIMGRPVRFLVLSVLSLLALALPALSLRTFTPDARIVPQSSPVRFGYDTVRAQFGPGSAAPIQVVIRSRAVLLDPATAGQVVALRDRLAGLAHVTRVDSALDALRAANPGRPFDALGAADRLPDAARQTVGHFISTDRHTAVLEVIADDYASADSTRALLRAVRATAAAVAGPELRIVVGGETAEGVDANAVIEHGLPAVVAIMLAVIYLVLLVTFRSVLLAAKAIALNLLSLGATYGILVLVFQRGLGAGLLGQQQVGYIQNFVPILLLAILFSLSTDYEVFLLNRIREEHDAGADDTTSVAHGIAHTAPLISGAAVLMVTVFGAFAFTGILPIQQLGFGLAVAIALDATVLRLVVVPAAMQLMGRWNWWLPARRPAPPDPANRPGPTGRHRGLRPINLAR